MIAPAGYERMGAVLPPWTPSLDALELLLSVAQTGSIAQAATQHGITQPSASAKLSLLERRTGVSLFARSATGTQLTPAGETVAAWAADVVGAARALADGLVSLRGDLDARLNVAASMTIAEYLLPTWLVALRFSRPGLVVAARVANSQDVLATVRAGEADLGFVETPDIPTSFESHEVGADEVVLAVATNHPLAQRAGAVAPSTVLDMPLLMREPGSGTRDTFLHGLATALGRHADPTLPHSTTLGSTATILASARAGAGVAVVSALAVAGDVSTGVLRPIPVTGLNARRPLTAVWIGHRVPAASADLIRIATGSV